MGSKSGLVCKSLKMQLSQVSEKKGFQVSVSRALKSFAGYDTKNWLPCHSCSDAGLQLDLDFFDLKQVTLRIDVMGLGKVSLMQLYLHQ